MCRWFRREAVGPKKTEVEGDIQRRPKRRLFLFKNFPSNSIFIALFWYSQEAHPAVFSEFVWNQLRILFTFVGVGFYLYKAPVCLYDLLRRRSNAPVHPCARP